MEKEAIHTALQNLRQITGIDVIWYDNGPLDGTLDFIVGNHKCTYKVEFKNELRYHNFHTIEEHFIQNRNLLLIARHIFPKLKAELRNKEIPYLEINGNIYLKNNNLFFFIDTQKPLQIEKNKGNRAFTKTGLKVLFYLLQNKEAINLTQRELAEFTNVGLGTIPQVIEGLKDTGYLIPLNNKTYIWENRTDLLDRWIAAYATELRPKLIKDRYALKGNWHELEFDQNKTVWGGEPAADILTNYLRPEKFIVYTKENRMDLIKKYKLMPDTKGEIEVLDMFWEQMNEKTAPPLLIYAELMMESGKRNKETAEIIFNEYIRENI